MLNFRDERHRTWFVNPAHVIAVLVEKSEDPDRGQHTKLTFVLNKFGDDIIWRGSAEVATQLLKDLHG